MQPWAIKESACKKLKPVATSVATGFCSPQNKIKLTPHSAGARIILNYFFSGVDCGPGGRISGRPCGLRAWVAWALSFRHSEGLGIPRA